MEYPPWDEPGSAMRGKPELFIPIMGPLTGHSCMPSRYIVQRVAVSHLNRRDATYCPAIANLQHDFEIKYAVQDSHASGSGAVVAAMKLMESDTTTGKTVGSEEAKVKVVLGPNSSPEAVGVHPFLGGAFGIPYLSWAATMGALGNKDVYKYFFRVVAPDSVTLGVQAGFIHWLGYSRVNILYIDDQALTTGQAEDFGNTATVSYGMQVRYYAISRSSESAGSAMNEDARQQTRAHLIAIEGTKTRIIGCYGFGLENRDIFQVANSLNMAVGPGWLWFSGDGLNGAQFVGDPAADAITRATMSGTIFVMAGSDTPYFDALAARWRADMSNISTPEFTEQPICHGSTICETQSDFFGMDRAGSRCLNSWLQEAYVSMVTLAVAADRLMTSTGKNPSNFTKDDWFAGLRTFIDESFSCLSGRMQLSANQERAADVSFFQWQANSTAVVKVATWDATSGYGWVPGETLVWADGSSHALTSRNQNVTVPTGRPPVCPSGQAYDQEELRCKPCEEGYISLMVDDVAVCTCAEGYGTSFESDLCQPCPPGTSKPGPGGQPCGACLKGTFSSSAGSVSCDACPQGTYTEDSGRSECVSCGLGYTTELIGTSNRSKCTCSENYYHDNGGCVKCAMGAMTNGIGKTSSTDCLCPSGAFRPKDKPYSCDPCLEGMICESTVDKRVFGSVERGGAVPDGLFLEPQVDKFFWAGSDDTLLVFRCASSERCPGGIPGSACSSELSGRACTTCPADTHWNGITCEVCSWFDSSLLIFPIFPLALGPAVVLFLYKMFGDTYEKWNNAQNGCASVAFILLNHYQIVYILAGADVPFTTETSSFMGAFSFSHDISTPFNLECRGFRGLRSGLIVRGLGPVVVALVFVGTWAASRVYARFWRKPERAMEVNRTLNGFFSLMLTFFAGIVEMALMLFKCGSNTNDNRLKTLVADRSVICFQDDWNGMLGIGVAAVIFWVCGFGSLFVRTVIMAPTWFHDTHAQMRWKFLFIKYRPDVHWWALTFVGKGLLLNLVFVIFDAGLFQIYSVIVVALIYSLAIIMCMPWRHTAVNYVDVWLHQCIIQVCSVLLWFLRGRADDNGWQDTVMNKMLVAFGTMGIPAGALVMTYLFWNQYSRIAQKANEDERHRVWTAMVEVAGQGEDQFMTFMNSLSDWDFYCLTAAMRVMVTDFFGLRVRNGLTVQQPVLQNVEHLLESGYFESGRRGSALSGASSMSSGSHFRHSGEGNFHPTGSVDTQASPPPRVHFELEKKVRPTIESPPVPIVEEQQEDPRVEPTEERTRQLTARPAVVGVSGGASVGQRSKFAKEFLS